MTKEDFSMFTDTRYQLYHYHLDELSVNRLVYMRKCIYNNYFFSSTRNYFNIPSFLEHPVYPHVQVDIWGKNTMNSQLINRLTDMRKGMLAIKINIIIAFFWYCIVIKLHKCEDHR